MTKDQLETWMHNMIRACNRSTYDSDINVLKLIQHIENLYEAGRADEREACAKLCEEMGAMEALDGETETSAVMVRVADKQSRLCAAAIRARDMYTKPQNVNTSAERVHETDKSVHDDDDIQEYKKPWVSLTDEEMENLVGFMRGNTMIDFARAIEDKLKERNT